MQLSCLPVSFFNDIVEGRMTVAEWARMGAAAGLDGIDLSIAMVLDHSPRGLKTLRHDVETAGMGLVMLTSYPDFTHPDPLQRERELTMEQGVVRVAAALGARFVRVTAGQAHPETGRADGIRWAVAGLTRLVETTRGTGVSLVYENHAKPGVWTYTDFSQPPDIFLEIVHATAAAGLGVNFDTGNAASFADDPVKFLEQVIGRVVTIHAADTATHGALQHVLLGTGITPYAALFKRLKQAGWDGWICMEEAAHQGQAGVGAAARFVRQTWNETQA